MPITDLQRLALSDVEARVPLYWRGPVTVEGEKLVVAPGGTLDLGTWFNAAPVGWWRELIGPGHLRLQVRATGKLTVWASGGGSRRIVESRLVDGPIEMHLPRTEGTDWYWLELAAGPDGGSLESASWASGGGLGRNRGRATQVTVVVPTYGREADAQAQIRRLTQPALDETVGRVVVIDQGSSFLAAPGTGTVLDDAGDRAVVLEQDNLGGSGGYSRGMVESLRWPHDPVFLLDDDAEVEPEALRRMHALSMLVPDPTILGTGLLSAESPTSLEALAEGIDKRTFHWGPIDGLGHGVDASAGTPDRWGYTRPQDRPEYTGWWGTFLPAGTVERIGLAAPYFLKWDDAEYGLRARASGLAVAVVPGCAVWHPTWAAKGTISSWSAWPLHRNRLATAAAYGAGRGVLLDSFVHQVKHVLSLQYGTAELWNEALAEVVDGPAWLENDLTAVRPRAQAALDAAGPRPGTGADGPTPDPHVMSLVAGLWRGVAGLFAADGPRGRRAVSGVAQAQDFTWRLGLGRDEVRIGDTATAAMVRDRRRARGILQRSWRLHVRAARTWRRLRAEYRAAVDAQSGLGAWSARLR
ncbi:glycosyl transferase [Paraoerskovia sediminicola]|uniref:Glycosyl transferase n=1 Tax=Paraoerskovia sediminicola TaxID=1138587 RepID=A0ABM8G3Y8_9CELL|nr:glycosyltransferase [Paraoerskovia sediminicola]BDZ42859.1 glycosyl transferase [Paraoerskovia sediminicola]